MPLNVALLRETFSRAKMENGGLSELGHAFYNRLFEKYPQVRPLFNEEPKVQQQKLMASVSAIVSSVTHPDTMLPYLHAMGIRHLKYGTHDDHYAAVCENFVSVLGDHLSQQGQWTPEMKETWQQAMDTVSNIMKESANHPEHYEQELVGAGFLPNGVRNSHKPSWELDTHPV